MANTIKGTKNNDSLMGTNADDTIFGLGGNDTLGGGKGDDELLGGDGDDLFVPGAGGYDAMDGGSGIDTVSYADIKNPSGVLIAGPTVGKALGYVDALGDNFRNIENFIGTSTGDTFNFTNEAVKFQGFVYGGGGADTIYASGGIMRGDQGQDKIYCSTTAEPVETVWLQRGKGADTVYNFFEDYDIVRLDGEEFGIGSLLNMNEFFVRASDSNATGGKAQLIYRDDTDQLYSDLDGTGSEEAVLVATFVNAGTLSFSDFEIV